MSQYNENYLSMVIYWVILVANVIISLFLIWNLKSSEIN